MAVQVDTRFDFLSPAYRDLYASANATAFQAPIWMDALHRQLAPAKKAQQHTITLRRTSDNQLMAVFPLVRQKAAPATLIMPADFGVCDYNALVAAPTCLEQIAANAAMLDTIDRLLRPADLILFRKMRADGFNVARILRKAAIRPADNDAFHYDIGSDFDVWQRDRLSKKFTKELRRKERQFVKNNGPWSVVEATDPAMIDAGLALIRQARCGRFPDDLLAQDVFFDFYRDYAKRAIPAGEAGMITLMLNEVPIAAIFGMMGDGRFHATLLAGDVQRFGRFSPGTQMVYRAIEKRAAEGHTYFDMCIGDSGYKAQFSAERTRLHNLSIANTMIGQGVAMIYHHAKPLKDALRKAVPHVR